MGYNYAAEKANLTIFSPFILLKIVNIFFACGFSFGGKYQLAKIQGCCTV